MRILFLCHRIPYPPDKGDKIRAFHELQALAARHTVDVFTLADDASDIAHREALAAYCNSVTVELVRGSAARWRSLPVLLTGQPLTLKYFYSAALHEQVRRALASHAYDRVVVYCSAMGQYLDFDSRIPVIMDFVDMDSDKWRQYAEVARFPLSTIYRREARTLRVYERELCGKCSGLAVTTEREARVARGIHPAKTIHVIPNGVDTAYFDPAVVPRVASEPTVIFAGDMGYFPNEQAAIHFATEVLPLVRRSVPGTRFLIAGRRPGKRVLNLKSIDGVEVTGFVPDIRSCLARAHVSVAPFRIGTGIQNKVLEAMSYGLPVVLTPRAAQGIAPGIADCVDIGDSADELASKIVPLLRNPDHANRRGMENRRRVAHHYSWDSAMEFFLRLVEQPSKVEIPGGGIGCFSSQSR